MTGIAQRLMENVTVGAPAQNVWNGNNFDVAPSIGGIAGVLQGNQPPGAGQFYQRQVDETQQQNQPYQDYFDQNAHLRRSWEAFQGNQADQRHMLENGYNLTAGDWLRWHHNNTDGVTLPGTDFDRAGQVFLGEELPPTFNPGYAPESGPLDNFGSEWHHYVFPFSGIDLF